VIVGLLHPGAMGAAVGTALVGAGRRVRWDPTGRSPATARRADQAGLVAADDLPGLVAASDIVLSVCPPHAAVEVAEAVAGTGRLDGRSYVDANAVAPATARRIAGLIAGAGGRYVDGGIIGPPPAPGRPCRLVLSGPHAAGLLRDLAAPDGGLQVELLAGDTAASALKMAYAAWTKGTAALLLAIRATARREGVEDALVAEWARSSPEPLDRSEAAAVAALAKGWRWVAEMEEIARTFADAGLPGGFHEAAAEVYRRSADGAGTGAGTGTGSSATGPRSELDVALDALLGRLPKE
jgi:3-hydroxyisobutyrate dehydrogenase-like beta-hydroxyacid dehydrogenase